MGMLSRITRAARIIVKGADDIAHWSEAEGGWWPVIREGFAGAWQENITIRRETLLAFTPVYACITRIAQDIGKMPIRLMEQRDDRTWAVVTRSSPYGNVVSKPNGYQLTSQFLQQWLISKLLAGNSYQLKQRDARGIVQRLYPLDPTRVRPLITPTGDIFYNLGYDPLSELYEAVVSCPASEIIHDRMPGLFHPLIGTSPIFACSLAAAQGHSMQKASAAFFKNMAQPSGVLTAPGAISDQTAARLKEEWSTKFSGHNIGRVAVLGDGLKFEPITVTSQAAQMVEQLKLAAEMICTAFNVPAFMVGVAPPPAYTNIEALTQQYWSQCLQAHIEGIESGMTEGLELDQSSMKRVTVVKLDIKALLRMDTAGRFNSYKLGIGGGFMAPNEARLEENLVPVKGGDTPYLQVQNYSLAALAERDEEGPPTSAAAPGAAPAQITGPEGIDYADVEDTGDDDISSGDATGATDDEVIPSKQYGDEQMVRKILSKRLRPDATGVDR